MRINRAGAVSLVLFCTVLLMAGTALAKIPEPDNIIYGPLSVNGQPLTSGEITLKVEGSPVILASFSVGSSPYAGNSFILRVPMDSGDPQSPSAARQGDVAGIYLNNQLAATVTLGPRGTVMKVPLEAACLELTDFFPDADNDGYPGGPPVRSCVKPAGYKTLQELVSTALDCNDNDPLVHGPRAFFLDADGDGYGNPLEMVAACYPPAGYVANNFDCNDSKPKEHPGQVWYKDGDADGYSDMTTNTTSCGRPKGYKLASELTSMATDCNDNDASVHPGAVELCDRKDNDCNGVADNNCVGDYGKMSRNSHYLKQHNWIIRAYTTLREIGRYSVYLEVVETGGTIPSAYTVGLGANPMLVSAESVAPDITLVFDEETSEAYVVYSTNAGQVLNKIQIRP